MTKKITIFALAAHGKGISGGDRIFMEFARNWSKKVHVEIYLWEEGFEMCKRSHLFKSRSLKFKVINIPNIFTKNFLICYFVRILIGVLIGLRLSVKDLSVVYSASEFWMDTFPAAILKIRCRSIFWVATWYQTAPSVTKGFSIGKRDNYYFKSAILYYLAQMPIKPLIKLYSDFVLVNNSNEVKQFSALSKKSRVAVVLGAVDLDLIKKYKRTLKKSKKYYDAVFQGRFHPQKGVVELIDIWKIVVRFRPQARLVMIGDGPLMKDVKEKIKKLNLTKNIILKGYLFDGSEKYRIFSLSRLVLHPAFYDSGGMASSEAMAFGLPCVAFDLPAYESYYPKGLLKARIGNKKEFAESIIRLLGNKVLYKKLSKEALDLVYKHMSWAARSEQILERIQHKKL